MLDVRRIREEPDAVRERLAVRGDASLDAAIDRVLELDASRRSLVGEVDEKRARRNEVSPQVAELKRAGKSEDADAVIREMRALGDRLAEAEARLGEVEADLESALLEIPNTPAPDVPPGGEADSTVLREWGEEPADDLERRPHWEVGEALGILDLPRGARISGSGFPVYMGAGARLERALINFMVDLHTDTHGYTEVWPPLLVNGASARGTGHLPKFAEDMYHAVEDDLYLVPTAEVPLTNLHAGEILAPEDVPRRYAAYTPCFRREAGAHGKDTRGLLRLHQFDKVEMVRFERPETSEAALEELTAQAEAVLRALGLRYRVLLLAGGDLGFANAKTYDLEAWAPAVGRWLEVSSCSNYTDYQARRAEIRFRAEPGSRPEYVHTLNGSGLGIARTMVALLETFQQADGSIRVPDVLVDYVGTDRIA
ncbi:MAG TPA: serine--tRNA ligase [Longimicrobiales bacterium]|nr:serine--tRNA ligase [Longimicrobiales bacterium]